MLSSINLPYYQMVHLNWHSAVYLNLIYIFIRFQSLALNFCILMVYILIFRIFSNTYVMNIRLLVIYFLLLTCQSTKSNMRSKWLLQKLPSLLKEWSMFFANNEHLYNQRRKLGKTCPKLALFNIKKCLWLML